MTKKYSENNSAIIEAELEGESAIQRAECPPWVEIGAALIKEFVSCVARSDATRRSYATSGKHLFEFLQAARAQMCSCFEVAKFYQALKGKTDAGQLKPSTMQAYLQAAGRIVDWSREHAQELEDAGVIPNASAAFKSLFPGKPFSNRPKVETTKGHKRSGLTVAETDAFLNCFESKVTDETGADVKSRISRRNRAMMYLMNELGLRCCELCRMRLKDVQTERNNVRIGVIHKGKTMPCQKYIDKEFAAARYLQMWKAEREALDGAAPGDFLFVSMSNRRTAGQMTTRTVENICVSALKEIGVKCDLITTHSIRHSFATQALEAVPVNERMQAAREIQETMGHSSLEITLTNYAHDIDSKESRIRHIREAQRLERLKASDVPERRRPGRPKGSKNKSKGAKARKTR